MSFFENMISVLYVIQLNQQIGEDRWGIGREQSDIITTTIKFVNQKKKSLDYFKGETVKI